MSGVQKIQRPVLAMAYTGPMANDYQAFRNMFESGQIDKNLFRQAVIRLNEKQTYYNNRLEKARERRKFLKEQRLAFEAEVRRAEEAERKRVEEALSAERWRKAVEAVRLEREAREAKRKAQAKARKDRNRAEVKKFQETVVYDETHTAKTFWGNEDSIYNACKKLEGRDACFLQITRNGVVEISKMIDIAGAKRYNIYYDRIRPNLFEGGGSDRPSLFGRREDETRDPVVRITLSRAQEIPSLKISQAFRDGSTHCVLEPLIRLFSSYVENSESKATKKRYQQVVNKLRGLLEIYDAGVPEDKMEEVAKACYRCLVVYDVLGNEVTRYNKNSPKMFHFTNTRENHLDVGHLTMDKQYTSVSQDELNTIMMEHDRDEVFYLFRGDFKKGVPQSIRSTRGAWAVFNSDYEIFQEFNKKMKIRDYRIDAVKYPVLNNFIKDGNIVHAGAVALCKKPNKLDGVSHYDMTKAYTQHETAPYFNGFLGHIHQWALLTDKNLEFVREHLGMYRFRVIENVDVLRRLGMRTGKEYTLPGPELLYMCDVLGLVVELVAGCWGSRAEIEYTPEMLEKRRYCTWAGKLGMESLKDCYMFKGSHDWACHLKNEIGEDRVSFWGDFICVKNPKKYSGTTHHLLAFITSYSRIHILEMMRRVDGELVKVVLDGLYFRGTMNMEGLPAKVNESKMTIHSGFSDGWYKPSCAVIDWVDYSPELDGDRVLAGAGGTGKTFRVFNDKSIYQPLYVVPSHLLGRKFREQYGVSYTTIHKLIGMDCMPYGEEHGAPHNIFIDELTMMDAEWVDDAVNMYPSSRFYIAGDIDGERWYQCRNGGAGDYSKVWIPSRDEWDYVDFTVDMRSRDDKLRTLKVQVREAMKAVFTDGGCKDAYRMNDVVRSLLPVVGFEEACATFRRGDVWIAGTHKTNARLLDAGIVSGHIHRKEAILMEKITTVEDWVSVGEGEKRGAFTVHSFQGLTISDRKVFISLDLFEYAMLYTAISRCVSFDQIVIVS